jgi:uncharacterized membrane protein
MKKRKLDVRDMILIGLFAAMCAVATNIQIPFGAGAMVHLGTAAIDLVGILFGGIYAGFAGAFGSALFDLVMGHSPYTVWSFVIKGIAGLIAGGVAKGLWPETLSYSFADKGYRWMVRAVLGCILSAAWTLFGYGVAWWQVTGSVATAMANLPSSLLTSGVGMVVALLLAPKLRKALKR